MKDLTVAEREFLIERLAKGDPIPEDFKEKLFPTTQKEYELRYAGKMRKEDLLSDEDGTFAVPLQIEKTYNGERPTPKDGWRNMIVFGDNLQFLKTIYKNTDPLVQNKVKGKVKLIYIDPPFGTDGDFEGSAGQKAYTDKSKDADFIEFVRRRLIVAREILADDGSIYVHLDWKKCHYVKLIMDEVFGENHFRNEVIWCYREREASKNFFNRKHDTLLFYTKTDSYIFNAEQITETYSDVTIGKFKYTDKDGRKYRLRYRDGRNDPKTESENTYRQYLDESIGTLPRDWFEMPIVNQAATERCDYPTQKPENLLERIMKASTNKDDLVLDFFGGSGTTAAVAEKLGRRWITCDIGKFSFYTIQKRLLTIQDSKSLDNPKKKYSKVASSFVTVNTGVYDLAKMQQLNAEKYIEFVLQLFEVTPKEVKRKGFIFHGERKDGYPVLVWDYWNKKESNLDSIFLESLHENVGKHFAKRVYIIVPINNIDFVSDYEEIDDVRYYFLKIPYQIINELHKKNFAKIRQPKARKKINDTDMNNAIGFHFKKPPEVESRFENDTIIISKFYTNFKDEYIGSNIENFETLSMVMIDYDFNNKDFIMNQCLFFDDMNEYIFNDELCIPVLPPLGNFICVIYIDIFGNEAKEVFDTTKQAKPKKGKK